MKNKILGLLFIVSIFFMVVVKAILIPKFTGSFTTNFLNRIDYESYDDLLYAFTVNWVIVLQGMAT